MGKRVLLAAGALAALVPTLLLAQQRPAQPPAQPAKPPAQQPAQRPAAAPAQRPAAPPVVKAAMPAAHREGSWELTVSAGALYFDKKLAGNSNIVPGGALRLGYHFNKSWDLSVGSGVGFKSSPSVTYIQPFAALTWTPDINRRTSPFITFGGEGTYASFTGGHFTAQYGGHAGVGVRHMIGQAVALRIEGRVGYEHFAESAIGDIPTGAATVGLSWFLGGAKVLTNINVAPGVATLTSLGQTQQLTARALDQKGNPMTGKVIRWSSNNPAVTVSATGVVTAVRDGAATISATSEGVTGTTNVTVARTAASVAVAPATATIGAIGATQAFTATARDANNNPLTAPTFTWASSDTKVATVDAAGVVTAVANGTARISATSGGKSGSVNVTVAQTTASVVVTPATSQISAAGATAQLSAQALDANGRPIAARTFTWTSDAAAVATVSPTGLATGVANGAAHVTAAVDGKSGSATVTVVIAPKGAPPVELPTLPSVGAAGLVLKNVTFRPNRAVLLPAAMADLDKIAIAIQAVANSKWEVAGYTSSVGTAARNMRLSQQRANAVKTYLVSKGVSLSALTAVGYGAQHPVATNRTAAGRAQNMRVEIKRLQ